MAVRDDGIERNRSRPAVDCICCLCYDIGCLPYLLYVVDDKDLEVVAVALGWRFGMVGYTIRMGRQPIRIENFRIPNCDGQDEVCENGGKRTKILRGKGEEMSGPSLGTMTDVLWGLEAGVMVRSRGEVGRRR